MSDGSVDPAGGQADPRNPAERGPTSSQFCHSSWHSCRYVTYRPNVAVLRTRFGLRDRSAARAGQLTVGGADSPVTGRIDSPWTLPVLAAALCAITAGSLFANGSAATVWLGLGLAAVLGGVPAHLVVGRLRGNPPDTR